MRWSPRIVHVAAAAPPRPVSGISTQRQYPSGNPLAQPYTDAPSAERAPRIQSPAADASAPPAGAQVWPPSADVRYLRASTVPTDYPRGIAASLRSIPTDYPRGTRGVAATRPRGLSARHCGVAATRPHGLSTWHPRRRRDPSPRTIREIAASRRPRSVSIVLAAFSIVLAALDCWRHPPQARFVRTRGRREGARPARARRVGSPFSFAPRATRRADRQSPPPAKPSSAGSRRGTAAVVLPR